MDRERPSRRRASSAGALAASGGCGMQTARPVPCRAASTRASVWGLMGAGPTGSLGRNASKLQVVRPHAPARLCMPAQASAHQEGHSTNRCAKHLQVAEDPRRSVPARPPAVQAMPGRRTDHHQELAGTPHHTAGRKHSNSLRHGVDHYPVQRRNGQLPRAGRAWGREPGAAAPTGRRAGRSVPAAARGGVWQACGCLTGQGHPPGGAGPVGRHSPTPRVQIDFLIFLEMGNGRAGAL